MKDAKAFLDKEAMKKLYKKLKNYNQKFKLSDEYFPVLDLTVEKIKGFNFVYTKTMSDYLFEDYDSATLYLGTEVYIENIHFRIFQRPMFEKTDIGIFIKITTEDEMMYYEISTSEIRSMESDLYKLLRYVDKIKSFIRVLEVCFRNDTNIELSLADLQEIDSILNENIVDNINENLTEFYKLKDIVENNIEAFIDSIKEHFLIEKPVLTFIPMEKIRLTPTPVKQKSFWDWICGR